MEFKNLAYICSMQKVLFFIVILFFAKPIFPVLDFVINYDAIQELCINKNLPELQCNGTCHLKNELAKTAQSENPFAAKKTFQLHYEILFFENQTYKSQDKLHIATQPQHGDWYLDLYSFLPNFKEKKPPLV
ncbi:hypothetical protein ACYSNX_10880 [Myroides sp. LJL115]